MRCSACDGFGFFNSTDGIAEVCDVCYGTGDAPASAMTRCKEYIGRIMESEPILMRNVICWEFGRPYYPNFKYYAALSEQIWTDTDGYVPLMLKVTLRKDLGKGMRLWAMCRFTMDFLDNMTADATAEKLVAFIVEQILKAELQPKELKL